MESERKARRFALRAALVCVLGICCASALPAVAAAATEGIEGKVTNAETFEPVSGANVCLYEVGGETQITCEKTDAKGEYKILEPHGSYKVRFEASGRATQWYSDESSWDTADTVEVKSGLVTPDIDAALKESGFGSITGRVTSNGQGLGGIYVCAFSFEEFSSGCAETNGSGEYTISDLGVGVYDVSFSPQYNSCEEEIGVKVRCVPNANVIEQTVDSVRVKAGQTETVNVSLQAGGQISGTVTNASITHPSIAKIEVWAYHVNSKGESDCCGYGRAWTSGSGGYTISGLPSGPYKVYFGGDICAEVARAEGKEQECTIAYVGDYYHEKASFEKAEAVNVTVGSNTSGINESLREAFPTTPASTAAPTLTGTPAVGQSLSCSQGSWSHEPPYVTYQWLRNGTVISGQTGSTYKVQGADVSHSITCSAIAGNGAGSATATSNAVAIPVPLAVFAGVKVKGSIASVTLSCPGVAPCSGVLKLATKVKAGKGKKAKSVTIGLASFSIAAGKRATLKVRLTGQGAKLLGKSGRNGLAVQIAGSGVKAQAAKLKPAAKGAAKKGKKK